MDLGVLLVIAFGSAAAFIACTGLSARERRLALIAYGLHVVSSFGQDWLQESYYGLSDAFAYETYGRAIAAVLDHDFFRFAPEVVKAFLHLDSALPFEVTGEGTSTGTMSAVAGVFVYVAGPSLLSLCLVTTWISWFGQLCWYRVARAELPPEDERPAIYGFLFVPSAVFWGAAFAKESLVLGAFGLLGLSLYSVFRNGRVLYAPGIVLGLLGTALLKAYTLLPFVLAVAAYVYAARASSAGGRIKVRPLYLGLSALIAVAGIAAVGNVFPEYAADHLTEAVSLQQDAWQGAVGGSDIEKMGGESAGLTEQLELVPVALMNAFLRPAFFEAKSPPALGAAIETGFVAVALVLLLFDGRGVILRSIFGSPFLLSSVIFVVFFGMAVGLTTSNLGSLSRYRVPMMPFSATLLFVLLRRRRDTPAVGSRRAKGPPARRRLPVATST